MKQDVVSVKGVLFIALLIIAGVGMSIVATVHNDLLEDPPANVFDLAIPVCIQEADTTVGIWRGTHVSRLMDNNDTETFCSEVKE